VSAATARLPIPRHLLIAAEPFAERLSAQRVLAAIARGVQAAGSPEPDLCPLPAPPLHGDPRALLDQSFDARMRGARAVILAVAELNERTLPGSLAFEIATRARQGGVPAYAITANNSLDGFDARVLDLQVIVQARAAATLTRAGARLASLA
jgi:glycerate kinase